MSDLIIVIDDYRPNDLGASARAVDDLIRARASRPDVVGLLFGGRCLVKYPPGTAESDGEIICTWESVPEVEDAAAVIQSAAAECRCAKTLCLSDLQIGGLKRGDCLPWEMYGARLVVALRERLSELSIGVRSQHVSSVNVIDIARHLSIAEEKVFAVGGRDTKRWVELLLGQW